ncbi:MAG: RNA-binding protein [Thermoprotei archaeon]|jgi:DNA-binding protein Alba
MSKETVIEIGELDTMEYVKELLSHIHEGMNDITVKGTGFNISKAVDVVLIVRNKFVSTLVIKDINIGTTYVTLSNGKTVPRSWISIHVKKEVTGTERPSM